MFEMEDGEAIRTNGSGVRGKGNGSLDHGELKGVKEWSRGCLERILRIRRRVVGLDL